MSTKLQNKAGRRPDCAIRRRLTASIAGVCLAIGVGSSMAHAAAVTYTYTLSGFSGNYGTDVRASGTTVDPTTTGTQFTNGVLTFSVTTDTNLIGRVGGGPASEGGYNVINGLNGTAFSYSLTGTGLSGPISGTFYAMETFDLYSGVAPLGNGNFLLDNPNANAYLSFMRPGTPTSPAPTLTTFANNYTATVNRIAGNNNVTTATPNDYLGGSNAGNWDSTNPNLYKVLQLSNGWMTFTSPTNQYSSGSWSTVVASSVPGSGLACLGSLGLAGFARRRR